MTILQPKLRFPEFNGDWKENKLGEVLTIGSGKDYKHLESGNVPVFGTGGYMTSVNKYLYDGETVCIGRKGTIDSPMYYKGKLWTVDTLFFTHSFKNSAPKFIYYIFSRINWKEYNEASGVPSLSKNTIEKISIKIPSIKEQNKIATFLTAIDERLQSLRQKKVLLENYKKGVLKKIFSQELKFKQDNQSNFSEWEEKTLEEITDKIGDGLHGTPSYSNNTGLFFINGNNLVNGKIVITENTKEVDKSEFDKNNKFLNQKTLLISINGTIGNIARYNNENIILGKSVGYLIFKEDVSYYFFLLQTEKIQNFFTSELTGSTIKNLSLKTLRETLVSIPSLPEQKKITEFLYAVDKKIEIVIKQIDIIDKYKKGLLQLMFC